jgi:cell division protein FtsW
MGSFNFFAERPVEQYRKGDIWLIALTILLWGLGMVTLFICSTGYGSQGFGDPLHFVKRQLVSSFVGFIGLLFFVSLRMDVIRKLLPVFVFGSLILCLMTFLPKIGVERNGARRWIVLPYLSTFQPSELIKFTTILFLANLLDKQARISNEDERSMVPAFIGLGVFVSVIFLQKDFSTGFFVFLVGLVMFFVSGAKMTWFIPFAGLGIPFAALMILIEPYRVNRLIGFIAPDDFQRSINYQLFAARRAISAGGFWGQGIGTGLTRINSIPEVHADYVFAGWTEAMGLFGVFLYFLLLGFFGWRAFRAAFFCSDRFAAFGTFGCATVIIAQSLMNIAVVCGVIPTTGIPLPFFSSGGSSIMVTLCMCGFIIHASQMNCNEITESFVREGVYE